MNAETKSHRLWRQTWFTYRIARAVTSLTKLKEISSLNQSFGSGVRLRFRITRRLRIPKDYPSQWRVGAIIIPQFPNVKHLHGVSFRTAHEYHHLRSVAVHLSGRRLEFTDFYRLGTFSEKSLTRLDITTANRGKESLHYRKLEVKGAWPKPLCTESGALRPLYPNVRRLSLRHDNSMDLMNISHKVDTNALCTMIVETSADVSERNRDLFAIRGYVIAKRCAFGALRRLSIPEQLIWVAGVAPELGVLRVAFNREAGEDFLEPRSLRSCPSLRALCLDLRQLQCSVPYWGLSGLELCALRLEAFELRLPPALTDGGGLLGGLWEELRGCRHLRRFSIHCSSVLLPQLPLMGLETVLALQIVTDVPFEREKLHLPPGLQRLLLCPGNEAPTNMG